MCFPTKRALLAAIVTLMGRQGQPVDVFRAMYLAVDGEARPRHRCRAQRRLGSSFFAEGETDDHRECVGVRLTPKALQELYIESKDLTPDARQAGHTAECGLCGKQVQLEKAWPDNRKRPCHPDCWGDAFGDPPWY